MTDEPKSDLYEAAMARLVESMDVLTNSAKKQVEEAGARSAAEGDEKLRLECLDRAMRYGGARFDDGVPHIVVTHKLIAGAREIYWFVTGAPPYEGRFLSIADRENLADLAAAKQAEEAWLEKATGVGAEVPAPAPSAPDEPSVESADAPEPRD